MYSFILLTVSWATLVPRFEAPLCVPAVNRVASVQAKRMARYVRRTRPDCPDELSYNSPRAVNAIQGKAPDPRSKVFERG
jgi:hypothetical protein